MKTIPDEMLDVQYWLDKEMRAGDAKCVVYNLKCAVDEIRRADLAKLPWTDEQLEAMAALRKATGLLIDDATGKWINTQNWEAVGVAEAEDRLERVRPGTKGAITMLPPELVAFERKAGIRVRIVPVSESK